MTRILLIFSSSRLWLRPLLGISVLQVLYTRVRVGINTKVLDRIPVNSSERQQRSQ